ncbi:DNA topoisomerase IB [Roseivirga sp. BDSF3-8]|uniref:DNA topoisomerase IB n=1 Tax=Roseivirga sp. BDSF3-8 TaxID=3241598 RepID=UPI00353257EA
MSDLPPGLVYVNDDMPGFSRRKHGRGFTYFDHNGVTVKDKKLRRRFQELKIPPIWDKVWICNKSNGHLQATGFDLKQRKQYLYHPEWNTFRSLFKFQRMVDFAEKLPNIRKVTEEHLALEGWPREKVMALVVKILDETKIRIGNEAYRSENETYGLTTLRRKHLEVKKGTVVFKYKAKSGKYRTVSLRNNQLSKMVKKCSSLPGYEIFRFYDEKKASSISSHDVNQYIQEISGEDYTAKDFRTWGGTVYSVKKYPEAVEILEDNPRKKLLPTLTRLVSEELGNTPAICKEYYIHPAMLEGLEKNKVLKKIREFKGKKSPEEGTSLRPEEQLALQIIKKWSNKKAKGRIVPLAKDAVPRADSA